MRTLHALPFAGLLALICFGCEPPPARGTGPQLAADCLPLAVIPFDSLSGHPNAGLIMADLLENELVAWPGIGRIPREAVRQALAPLEGEVKTPAELGELLQARSLLVGSVTEYRYKRGVAEEPVIGITLRLVSAADGRVLWSKTENRLGRHSWVREDSLSRLAHAVSRDLAGALAREFSDE